jgi:hypothetical protein
MANPTVTMIQPAGWNSGAVALCPSGATYQPDAYGVVANVAQIDISIMASLGFRVLVARDNFSATTDPGTSNDVTQDYAPGSRWINTTSGRLWVCVSNTASAAAWIPEVGTGLIAILLGANFNTTADQALTMLVLSTAIFRVSKMTVTNASESLTTAVGGLYDAASKGGNAIVAASQAYSGLTSGTVALDTTLNKNVREPAGTKLYLSLSTAQGSTATADVYVFGDLFSQ